MKKVFLFLCFSLFWVEKNFAQVTFIVQQIPANTPASDSVFIVGSFQSWNPGSSAHKLSIIGNGVYTITLPISGGIQYKYTRGSWPTVEGNSNGGFRPNRNRMVSAGDTLRDTILTWEDLGPVGGQTTAQPNVTRIAGFFMPQFNRSKAVWIYLPPDYHSSQKNYPVLYMHDGQNVFDNYTSFMGEWEVDETLNRLQQDSADYGCIVVGLESGPFRVQELTPYSHPQYGGGDGDKYIQFIIQNLKPWVDSTYRTLKSPQFTAIGGSSLGGLISFYAHQSYPQIFGKSLVFSPSYWFNDSIYLLPSQNTQIANGRIFHLAGAQESATMVSLFNRMNDSLVANGILPQNFSSVVKLDGQHSEWFWRREFGAGYRWLFQIDPLHLEEKVTIKKEGYPNPVGNHFTIEACQACAALLFDTTGRLVADFTGLLENEPVTADGQQTIWGLNTLLKPGIYVLHIQNQSQILVYRFIKE